MRQGLVPGFLHRSLRWAGARRVKAAAARRGGAIEVGKVLVLVAARDFWGWHKLSRSEPLVGELMLCHKEEGKGSYLELGTEAKYRHGAWARAQ